MAENASPKPTANGLPDEYVDPVWFWVFASEGDKRFHHYDSFLDRSQPGPFFPFDTTFSLVGRTPLPPLPGDFNSDQVLDT